MTSDPNDERDGALKPANRSQGQKEQRSEYRGRLRALTSARSSVKERQEFGDRDRVLEQERVAPFVAAELGSANLRRDRPAVLNRSDPVIASGDN